MTSKEAVTDWHARHSTSRDLLEESGRIVKGSTLLLATSAHLDAVVHLVKEAKYLIEKLDDCQTVSRTKLAAWRTSAEKLL